MGFWQNLRTTPGINETVGQLGSHFLAAPDFMTAFAGLGQVPGQLAQHRAASELEEAERRRREMEDRLLALRLKREELEQQALPAAQKAEEEARNLNRLGALLGLSQALKSGRQEEEQATARREFAQNIPSPGLSGLVATDPTLARQIGAAQAQDMIPPTEQEQLRSDLIRAQIDQLRKADRRIEEEREKLAQRAKEAERRLRFDAAKADAELSRRRLEAIDKALSETGEITPPEVVRQLKDDRQTVMDRFTEAQNRLQSLSRLATGAGQKRTPLTDGEQVMAKLTAAMEPQEAIDLLRQVAAAGKQEEFDLLVERGVHPAQAARMVLMTASSPEPPPLEFPQAPGF